MKIKIVHPLKHHIFYSIKGVSDSNHNCEAILGMYDNDDLVAKIIKKSKYSEKLSGYRLEAINHTIKTNLIFNMYFLAFQKYKTLHERYVNFFDRKSKKFIKDADCIHVLQDYCNEIINYSKHNKKIIVYEQIQPISYKQRNILKEEVLKYGFPSEYLEKFFPKKKIEKHVRNLQMADYVHTASSYSYNTALDIVGEENSTKVLMWPYGVNRNSLGRKFQEKDLLNRINKSEKLRVLYVGSISLIKGVQYLIEVIDNMKDLPIDFTIVGLPRYEEDKVLVKKLLKFENVKYICDIPHTKIGNVYKENDLFLFPALMEGFGMVTLEAMSYGLPCIVNDNCKGVVNDREDGIVVSPRSSKELIQVLNNFIENRQLLKELSVNAYKNAKIYSWDKYANCWKDFYNNLYVGDKIENSNYRR